MNSYDEQINSLKQQLKNKNFPVCVTNAIKNEINRLKVARTGIGKDRVARTTDGAEVQLGDLVYQFELPGRKSNDEPPRITELKIAEINRVGKVRFANKSWRPFIEMNNNAYHGYYSTIELAYAAMKARAQENAVDQDERVKSAQEQSVLDWKMVDLIKAWKPIATPAK